MIRVSGPALALAAALASVAAVPALADSGGPAVLHLSATADLRDNQRVTVSGSGFQPGLPAVAVGLCKQGFTNGLKDCDLGGGATFVNIAADGTFKTLTLTLHPQFEQIDCTRQQCVVAAAPLPGTEPPAVIAANSAVTPMAFAGAHFAPPSPAVPVAAATGTGTRGPSAALWWATAGLLVLVSAITFADRRRTRRNP